MLLCASTYIFSSGGDDLEQPGPSQQLEIRPEGSIEQHQKCSDNTKTPLQEDDMTGDEVLRWCQQVTQGQLTSLL